MARTGMDPFERDKCRFMRIMEWQKLPLYVIKY